LIARTNRVSGTHFQCASINVDEEMEDAKKIDGTNT
jgi:hypothetical protein